MKSNIEIKDIHIPQGVDVFPLAYGWWILFFSIIALFLIIKLIIFGIKTSKKHYALKKLKNIDTNSAVEAVIEMSLLLRRICNAKFKQASALYGQDWLDFLTKHSKHTLSEKASKLLVFAPFMDKNSTQYSSLDAQEVKDFCKHWIGENL